ncbi:prolyl 4-hydroxylase 1-like isoform X3 [Prosopis cineraria]|uniref:prolyl 4-hydroxylase 1-like isoform X3 n=1 Tax=Prosopis cineraria TaxID=364024 RepID=UPI00240F274E|nr:prolyl 4-hydroxylase 1-like isoform X3 [Prosopis cineraria]
MKFILGLLTFVTVILVIGSFSQLAMLRQLENSHGTGTGPPRFRRPHQMDSFLQLPRALPLWENDKEAETLRLGHIKPEVLSWSPRIILLHNFLSMEECEYLMAIGHPYLHDSIVGDPKTGKIFKSNVRTSSGMFLSLEDRKYPMVQAIEKQISIYAQVPIENGENMQILRYEKNQYYATHTDYFFGKLYNFKGDGQRIATMLMYLGDNVEGGETYFPMGGSGDCNYNNNNNNKPLSH